MRPHCDWQRNDARGSPKRTAMIVINTPVPNRPLRIRKATNRRAGRPRHRASAHSATAPAGTASDDNRTRPAGNSASAKNPGLRSIQHSEAVAVSANASDS